MPFDNDIFISYARIDNEALGADQDGWVSSLHRWLAVRLGQLRGVKPRIWRDLKLAGNDFFADEIVDQFPRVATLVSILSPRYCRSEWCLRELRAFWSAATSSGGLRVGAKARIFKVIKTPVPLSSQPQELQGLLGYEFATVDPETGRVRESNHWCGGELERRYWTTLDDLAQDLCQLLNRLDSGAEATPGEVAAPAVPGAPAGDAGTVYLAETGFDLREERAALRRDFQQHGYEVVPDHALPLLAPDLTAVVRDGLARSRLSVHLLGSSYGIVPEGATRSLVELQNELALERAAAGDFWRLVWTPAGLVSEDERQRALLERVRSDPRAQEVTDILETGVEALKEAAYEKLRPRPAAEEAPAAVEGGEGADLARVYLICDQRDLDGVAQLEDYLFGQGFEVILPVFEGDEAQVRLDHQENLRLCEAVLLYYGRAHELWLREKLRDLQKIGGYGRSRPMRAKAIFVGDPANPQKERLRTREAEVIRGVGGFQPALMAPFVQQLKAPTRVAP